MTIMKNKIASKFPHEEKALQAIIPPLNNQIEFIQNYNLYDPATNYYYECDLIAVCLNFIAIVELKHWSGEIEIVPYNWRVNRRFRKDPHKANKYKCQVLKGFIEREFPYLKSPWVESIVVLTNPDTTVHNSSPYKRAPKNPTFADTETLVKFFKYRLSNVEEIILTTSDRAKIKYKLVEQQDGPRSKTLHIPGYEILDNLTQTDNRIELLARVAGIELQTIKRLRVFLTDQNLSEAHRKEQKVKSYQTLKTLDQLGSHPNIIKVEPVPNDDGLLIEVSDWSEDGSLADVMAKETFSVEKATKIVRGIVSALVLLHQNAVVHRDLRPENIMMDGDTPKLMNFDYTYLPDDHTPEYTVFPDAKSLQASPFIAPELYLDGQFDETADLFSVGVIYYTMLCGEPPFESSIALKESAELPNAALAKLKRLDLTESLATLVASLVKFDRTIRPQKTGDVLSVLQEQFAESTNKDAQVKKVNAELEPGDDYDAYEIIKLIDRGSEAQVYLARVEGDRRVAIKLFLQNIARDLIYRERDNLKNVKSPYTLHLFDNTVHKWSDGRFFLVTNLVEGSSLRLMIQEGHCPSIEEFRHVASCLLQAVGAMHKDPAREKPLLHNDIKPDNILLSKSNDPVLIDFGTSCYPHTGLYSGTNYYVAPDLLRKIDFDFCESGDLFAIGVTLFEWLCGSRPYDGVPSISSTPKVVSDVRENDIPLPLVQWLDKALQPQSGSRFGNIIAMQEAFDAVWEPKQTQKEISPPDAELVPPELVAPTEPEESEAAAQDSGFVRYLNTLHNATAIDDGALAETQALSKHFGQIHVQLSQTAYILQQLTSPDGGHVLLTGHAGDGKSTIGLELYKKLSKLPLEAPLEHSFKDHEVIVYEGITIHIIKDMSELSTAEKNDKVTAALASDVSERWFIISNTGTLLSTFENIADQRDEHWFTIESKLLEALGSSDPEILPLFGIPFSIINLAKADNINTGVGVLNRILEHSGWKSCNLCNVHRFCPIKLNISSLLSTKQLALVRITWIYRRLKEYGIRLTMRQLTGHLVYSLTGGLDCLTVHSQAASPMPPEKMDIFFSNRFFGYTGVGIDEQANPMAAIQHIRELEMGSKPFPALDRVLWNQESDQLPVLSEELAKTVQPFLKTINDKKANSNSLGVRQNRHAIRRLYYIFGDFPKKLSSFVPQFLDSQMLVETEEWQNGTGPQSMRRKQLLRKILHVLQEEYTGFQLSENHQASNLYITLRRRSEGCRQSVQLLLAQIPLSSFTLLWRQLNQQFEPKRYILILQERFSQYELPLDLPFLDFVLMRDMGEIGQRLHPGYRDRLERFKTQLLEHSGYKTEQLVLLEMERNGKLKTRSLEIHEQVLQVTS